MASGGIAETGSDGGAPKGAAGTPPAASPAGEGPGAAPHPGPHPDPRADPRPPGGVAEVFMLFLRLGLTSFGGPTAHLGFFREAVVARRGWLDEAAYAELVALCQFMPGPASSQLGFALGLLRAGWAGAPRRY